MSVVPREIRARRHFGAGAIALALFVFGKLQATAAEAASKVGSWASGGAGSWRLLRRWVGAVERGDLFPGLRASPPGWSPRQRAERIAMALAAHAPATAGDSEEATVFAGAALAR